MSICAQCKDVCHKKNSQRYYSPAHLMDRCRNVGEKLESLLVLTDEKIDAKNLRSIIKSKIAAIRGGSYQYTAGGFLDFLDAVLKEVRGEGKIFSVADFEGVVLRVVGRGTTHNVPLVGAGSWNRKRAYSSAGAPAGQ